MTLTDPRQPLDVISHRDRLPRKPRQPFPWRALAADWALWLRLTLSTVLVVWLYAALAART